MYSCLHNQENSVYNNFITIGDMAAKVDFLLVAIVSVTDRLEKTKPDDLSAMSNGTSATSFGRKEPPRTIR